MAAAEVEVSGNEWKKYEISIASPYDDTRGKFRLELAAHGTVDVDHISLFPKNTFKFYHRFFQMTIYGNLNQHDSHESSCFPSFIFEINTKS